jgi:hypothetical protein
MGITIVQDFLCPSREGHLRICPFCNGWPLPREKASITRVACRCTVACGPSLKAACGAWWEAVRAKIPPALIEEAMSKAVAEALSR